MNVLNRLLACAALFAGVAAGLGAADAQDAYSPYGSYGQAAPPPYQGDATSVYGGSSPQYPPPPTQPYSPPPVYSGPRQPYDAPPPASQTYSPPPAQPYSPAPVYSGPRQPYDTAPPAPVYEAPPTYQTAPDSSLPRSYTAPPPPAASSAGQDLLQVMQDAGQFRTFLQIVDAAGYSDALHRGGPYTVFAPTDMAFQRLPGGSVQNLLNNRAAAISFVRFHLTNGPIRVADLLRSRRSVQTLQGNVLEVGVRNNNATLNGAAITQTDLAASNGMVHGMAAFTLPVYPGELEGRREPNRTAPPGTPPAPLGSSRSYVPPPPPVVPTPPKTGAYPPANPSGGPAYYR